MKVLLLGPERRSVVDSIRRAGDEVLRMENRVDVDFILSHRIDFIVSNGYRHIIDKQVLDAVGGRAINLHISLLPWNRGADPNVWSFLEDTPKGVTIHLIDSGLDTGDILMQKSVQYEENDTLESSYARLTREIEELFADSWSSIRKGRVRPVAQPTGGTLHRKADLDAYRHLLAEGWRVPVASIIGAATMNGSQEG